MERLRFLSTIQSAPSSVGSTLGGIVNAKPVIEMSCNTVGSLPEDVVRELRTSADTLSLVSPLVVSGKSGVRHSFTLGMKDPVSIVLACDIVVSDPPVPIDETKVLSLFIKVYDVNANRVVLCAVPSLTPPARKLASQYKMAVVDGSSKEQVLAKLQDTLRELSKNR